MPFTTHIIHAILINFKRLPHYFLATRGSSFFISLGLISFEVAIIPLALFYDIWARIRFSALADHIMVEDFISMDLTPQLKLKSSEIPKREVFEKLDVKIWRKSTQQYLNDQNWQKASENVRSIRKSITQTQAGSYYLCLHFLESVELAINNSIKWMDLLSEDKRQSFMRHRALFIWWQAVGFEGAQVLDSMAFAIHQKKGVPILINDVPSIPV